MCVSHFLCSIPALTSAPGLMSVSTGLHRLHCSNGGRRGWAEHAPCTDSTARNTLTSEALLDPLIPEHHGQKTCRVGLAGIHPASRPGFYGIRTEREKNGIKDVILRISLRRRLSLYQTTRHGEHFFLSTLNGYDRSASSPFFPFFTFDRSSSSKRRTSINCSKHVLKVKKKQKHQT